MLADAPPEAWLTFAMLLLAIVLLDRVLFRGAASRFGVALGRSILWLAAGLGFAGYVGLEMGSKLGIDYLVAYLIEKSLSVDNLFVFLVIFRYFGLSAEHQRRVLAWGVAGAVLMRGVFIVLGAAALSRFHWAMYVFGLFLVFTGLRMAFEKPEHKDPERNLALRLAKKYLPVSQSPAGDRFFVRQAGRLLVTPLFVVLLVVEFTDVVFAIDSVPAVLAISSNLFVVYTSNILAILGLRALYFVLARVVDRFRYLSLGLSVILVFIGTKMLLTDVYHVSSLASLVVVGCVLAATVIASLLRPRSPSDKEPRAADG